MNGAQHPGTLASNFSYHPHGAVKLMTYGDRAMSASARQTREQIQKKLAGSAPEAPPVAPPPDPPE